MYPASFALKGSENDSTAGKYVHFLYFFLDEKCRCLPYGRRVIMALFFI